MANIKTDKQKEYAKYLRSEDWKSRKEYLSQQWNNECACCKKNKNLHLHHLSYDNLGKETIRDVILLCKGCHLDVHKNRLEVWMFNKSEYEAFKKIKHIICNPKRSYITFIVEDVR